MNKLLVRGGLVRATRHSGSPVVRTVAVRYQSSEEVAAQEHERDDVEARHSTANTTGVADDTPQQLNGSRPYYGNGVAPSPLPKWSNLSTAKPPQAGNGSTTGPRVEVVQRAFSRDPERAPSATSASAIPRGALNGNGTRNSPLSRVNGKVAHGVFGDQRDRRSSALIGADEGLPVERSTARQQNSPNNKPPRNPWDIELSLRPTHSNGAGGRNVARSQQPRRVETRNRGADAAPRRSGPLEEPRAVLNGASNLQVNRQVESRDTRQSV